MAYQIVTSNMDFQKLQDLLEGFVNTAELWIHTLNPVQKSPQILEEKASKGSSSDEPISGPGMRA